LAILDAMDAAIERRQELLEIVGAAPDADAARQAVMDRFAVGAEEATAVLELQVRRFSERERRRIREEAAELRRHGSSD
jgi:DNA gyrase/topoisomerase IV subunit A